MPNIEGFSKLQTRAVCDFLDLNCTFDGYGYVTKQSIKKDVVIKKNDELKVFFKVS